MFLIDATVSLTKRSTRRGGWQLVDCGEPNGTLESGGNLMGSERESLTFQVGIHILVLCRALGIPFSGIEGRPGSTSVGDGGDVEKNVASET